ncbi:MAG: class III signal peptide-containing protein [Candidatus Micrarchaeota archaeon]
MMKKKGQGSFEYVMLLAGILVIVVLAFVIMRGTMGSADQQTQEQECKRKLVMDTTCYYSEQDKIDGIIPADKDIGDWDPCGMVEENKYNPPAGSPPVTPDPPLCGSYLNLWSCPASPIGPGFGGLLCGQPPK